MTERSQGFIADARLSITTLLQENSHLFRKINDTEQTNIDIG